jgi:hypothetical protein
MSPRRRRQAQPNSLRAAFRVQPVAADLHSACPTITHLKRALHAKAGRRVAEATHKVPGATSNGAHGECAPNVI